MTWHLKDDMEGHEVAGQKLTCPRHPAHFEIIPARRRFIAISIIFGFPFVSFPKLDIYIFIHTTGYIYIYIFIHTHIHESNAVLLSIRAEHKLGLGLGFAEREREWGGAGAGAGATALGEVLVLIDGSDMMTLPIVTATADPIGTVDLPLLLACSFATSPSIPGTHL